MTIVGNVLAWGAGVALYGYQILQFWDWWGFWGLFLAIFIPPLAIAFPFVYLIVEGWSWLYFGLLAAFCVGLVLLRMGAERQGELAR